MNNAYKYKKTSTNLQKSTIPYSKEGDAMFNVIIVFENI